MAKIVTAPARLPDLPQVKLDEHSHQFISALKANGLLLDDSKYNTEASGCGGAETSTRTSGRRRLSAPVIVPETRLVSRPSSRNRLPADCPQDEDSIQRCGPYLKARPRSALAVISGSSQVVRPPSRTDALDPLDPSSLQTEVEEIASKSEPCRPQRPSSARKRPSSARARPSSARVQPSAALLPAGASHNRTRRKSTPQGSSASLPTDGIAASSEAESETPRLAQENFRKPRSRRSSPEPSVSQRRQRSSSKQKCAPAESFKGRWQSELDDPEQDTEMKLDKIIKVLSECGLLDERLASRVVRSFLEDVACRGADIPGLAKIAGSFSGGLSFTQFVGVLHYIAALKNIGYAECVAKYLLRFGMSEGSYQIFLREFWMRSCRATSGKMSAFDVLRAFDKTMLPAADRPNIGEIYIMFSKIQKKKSSVDFNEYDKFLQFLAEKLEISKAALLHKMFIRAPDALADDLVCESDTQQLKRAQSASQLELQVELEIDVHAPSTSPKHHIKTPSSKSSRKNFRKLGSQAWDETSTGYQSD